MNVTLHTPDTIYLPRHTPSWFALACAAGAVNGFAFRACEQFVSHISGAATRMGMEWQDTVMAFEFAAILISFVAGAMTSVLWIQARACRGKSPRWATPLLSVAAIFALTGLAGFYGILEPIGVHTATSSPPIFLLSVLAFALGLQNAAVATTTGLAVRTTHLTGPATDLGIHMATAFFATGEERKAALKGAYLRGGKIAAFVIGAGLSLPLANQLGYLTLLAPAALVSFAAALSFVPEWSPSDFPITEQNPRGRGVLAAVHVKGPRHLETGHRQELGHVSVVGAGHGNDLAG